MTRAAVLLLVTILGVAASAGAASPPSGAKAAPKGANGPKAANAAKAPNNPVGTSWKTGSEPLQVDSKTMTYASKENLIVFQGEVVAHQGEMTLHGDRVEVVVDQKTQEVRTVHAKGNVRILKEDMVATGEVADYDAAAGVAVLTGNPKVWRGKDVVAGDKITVYLEDNRSVVEGKVKAVMFPPAKKPESENK